MRNLFLAENLKKFAVIVIHSGACVDNKDGNICFVQGLLRSAHTQIADAALAAGVVKARRINNHDRAERENLHRLADRVRRRTADFRDHCKVLIRYRVDQAGFARVPASEKADMKTFRGRRTVQTHLICSSISGFSAVRRGNCRDRLRFIKKIIHSSVSNCKHRRPLVFPLGLRLLQQGKTPAEGEKIFVAIC